MRKNNEFNIFKSQKNNPRILKVTQLIKKTLSEVFLTIDFTNSTGAVSYTHLTLPTTDRV